MRPLPHHLPRLPPHPTAVSMQRTTTPSCTAAPWPASVVAPTGLPPTLPSTAARLSVNARTHHSLPPLPRPHMDRPQPYPPLRLLRHSLALQLSAAPPSGCPTREVVLPHMYLPQHPRTYRRPSQPQPAPPHAVPTALAPPRMRTTSSSSARSTMPSAHNPPYSSLPPATSLTWLALPNTTAIAAFLYKCYQSHRSTLTAPPRSPPPPTHGLMSPAGSMDLKCNQSFTEFSLPPPPPTHPPPPRLTCTAPSCPSSP